MTWIGGADTTPAQPLLGVERASKTIGQVQALHEVSLALYPGEVHGLVGDSGAGKSTLVKVLGGECDLDSGFFLLDGEPTVLRGSAAARAVGASIVHQWPPMLLDMDVAENIFRGRPPIGAGSGFDRAEMHRRADSILVRLGVELDPARPGRELSVADKQIVEIARAVSRNARVILMDESTVPLSPGEADRLLRVVHALRDNGAAVLFVSLFMDEIFAVCQRVSIIRGGRLVGTAVVEDITADEVVHLATGRKLDAILPKTGTTAADAVLEVEALAREGAFSDVSFQLRSGQIVALAGLPGAGCTEVARTLFGIGDRDAGHVKVRGRELPHGSQQAAMDAGLTFVPDDRSQQDLTMEPGIDDSNGGSAFPRRLARNELVRRAREGLRATRWAGLLRPEHGQVNNSVTHPVRNQLEALTRSSAQRPAVLIIDEPTRRVDLGTKAHVHWLMDELAVNGVAILMVSSEVPEILAMADRVLVFRAGRLVAELSHAEADEASIMRAASGQTLESAP